MVTQTSNCWEKSETDWLPEKNVIIITIPEKNAIAIGNCFLKKDDMTLAKFVRQYTLSLQNVKQLSSVRIQSRAHGNAGCSRQSDLRSPRLLRVGARQEVVPQVPSACVNAGLQAFATFLWMPVFTGMTYRQRLTM